MSDADLIGRIRERRATLTAQLDGARLQYADLEETIKGQQQALALLQRNLDAMHGGLQELDGLLAELEQDGDAP
jgi:septal ring factor EnvC (AmiA/AmiB activator)